MAKERVSTYRNTGTSDAPNWEQYFMKTVADAVKMSDADDETKTIKDYVDEAISNLVNGAPEAYDTLKELADAITENETVVNALNEAITNKANKSELLYSNSTPTVQEHGGIAAGTTFENVSIMDMLTKILYPYVAPTVTAKVTSPSNGGTFETGSTQTVKTITVTITKGSGNITNVEIFNGSTSLGSKSGDDLSALNSDGSATLTFSDLSVGVTSNQSFTAKVTDSDNKITTATTGTFSFVYPYYYGAISGDSEITADTVAGLTKSVAAKGAKTFTYTLDNQIAVYACPTSYGAVTIKDSNNVEYVFNRTTVSVTNSYGKTTDYYVYTLATPATGTYKFTFTH